MMRKDGFTLWEEEGDLNRMKLFFQNIDPGLEQKERIKQRALEKIREEDQSPQLGTKIPDLPEMGAETFRERIRRGIKSLWWRWQWKLAVPVVALLLMIALGQVGMNGSLSFPQGSMKKAAQSSESVGRASAPTAPAAYDMASSVSPKAEAPSILPEVSREFKGAPNGALNNDAKAKPSTGIVPPLPQPQPQTPPADESLPRKITYHMNASLQVEEVNLALERITQEVKSRGGYIVESSQNQYEKNSSAHATLKIPSNQLEGFRGLLSEVGKVLNQNTTANDITNQYYDSETRLRSWEAQEQRYLEILKKANTVDDILRIESYLGNIRMQIEQLKGQLKLWNHEVSYSTISLNLQTTPNPININEPWKPVSWANTLQAAKDAVLKTVSSTWNGLNYAIVGIAYALPYLLLGGILFGVYKVIRRSKR
jgi:hypothetical protein